MKTHQKGRALERAVRLIQESILRSDPRLKGAEFSIETNKIEIVSGVRHEIDVLVKTLPGSPYESTWIFECKNWRKPVGKNEVIVLARKVDLTRANRGFLVARSISKDAAAQLKLDNRLSFISCKDDFIAPFQVLQVIHLQHDLLPVTVYVKQRGVAAKENPEPLEWKDKPCCLKNDPIDLLLFINERVEQLVSDDKKENAAKYRDESTHFGWSAVDIRFEPGELMVGKVDVETMAIEIQFWVTIRKPRLLSKFELTGQGRVFSFESINSAAVGRVLQVDVVQRI